MQDLSYRVVSIPDELYVRDKYDAWVALTYNTIFMYVFTDKKTHNNIKYHNWSILND